MRHERPFFRLLWACALTACEMPVTVGLNDADATTPPPDVSDAAPPPPDVADAAPMDARGDVVADTPADVVGESAQDRPTSTDALSDLPPDLAADARPDDAGADAPDVADAAPDGAAPDAPRDAAPDAPDDATAADVPLLPDGAASAPAAVDLPVSGPAAGAQRSPALAVGGTTRLVVWSDDRRSGDPGDVYAARVTLDGEVLDARGLVVDASPGAQSSPQVAWDGAQFLVAWVDPRGVRARRLDASGHLLDVAPIVVVDDPNVESPLALAFDGANHVLAWGNGGGSAAGDVVAARVSPAGRLLDATPVTVDASPGRQSDPALASDGAQVLAVWATAGTSIANRLVAARFDGALRMTGRADVARATFGSLSVPRASYDGSAFQLAWRDSEESVSFVGTARLLAGSAAASGVLLLGGGPLGIGNPALACNAAGRCLTSWTRLPDAFSTSDPYAHAHLAVLQAGVVVGGERSGPASPGDTADTAAAWEGTRFAVAWSGGLDPNGPDVYVAPVTADGAPADGARTLASRAANAETRPAAATNGTNHLVAWLDGRDPGGTRLFGARVTHDGATLDPAGIAVSGATLFDHVDGPVLASNGTDYLVVWAAGDPAGAPGGRIFGARVSGAGRALDAPFEIARSTGRQLRPAVASDGADWFVTWWHEGGTADGFADVRGARVSAAGALLDPASLPVSTAPGNQLSPVVGFDGLHYLVAWADERPGLIGDALYVGRFDRTGRALDGDGVRVYEPTDRAHVTPMGVSFDGARFLVAWVDGRGSAGPSRIMAARVGTDGRAVGDPAVVQSGAVATSLQRGVAYDGTRHVLAWTQVEAEGTSLRLGWVTPAGDVVAPSGGAALVDLGTDLAPALSSDRAGHTLLVDSRRVGTDAIAWSPRVEARAVRPGG